MIVPLLAAPVMCSLGSADVGKPKFSQTEVFVSGKDGYHTYRIPAIVLTKKGTLLAFCEGRKTSRSDHGDIDLVLRRSFDSGRTWTPMQIVHEEGGTEKITIGNPCPVVDRTTGTIWLTFCRNNDRVFVTRSADDGATWARPVEITKDVKPANWTWYATGPCHGIQLSSGRLLIPCDHRERAKGGTMFSHVFYSDDHGASWKLGGSLSEHTDECTAVESTDGRVYLNMRSYHGKNRRATAWSQDGGATWSAVKLDETLIEPVCQASVIRLTDTGQHDKHRVLFSNPAGTKRERMTVRISYDECKTWPVAKLVYAGPSAYSDLCVMPDGTICLLYECGKKGAYETITMAQFNLEWLTDGADRLVGAASDNVGAVSDGETTAMRSPSETAPTYRVTKHLLLDSRIIDKTDGVRLTIGHVTKDPRNPLFKEDRPWEPRFDNLYANVIYDEQDGNYKCWYSPFIIDQRTTSVPRDKRAGVNYIKIKPNLREMGVCYATSQDGLTWTKPELGLVDFDGSKKNNIVFRGPHGVGVMKDLREPDPARLYKMFGKSGEPGVMSVAFSSDGLRWSKMAPCREIERLSEYRRRWAVCGRVVG